MRPSSLSPRSSFMATSITSAVPSNSPSSSRAISSCLRTGSVRTRARRYRLSWDEANPGSCGLQNGQHGRGPPEVEQSAAVGGNVLMVAGARAEKVAEFIVSATEPGRRSWALEAPHGSVAAFDAAVILLQPVVQVGAGPVPHIFAQLGADRPGVAVVAVGRDPVRRDAGDRLRGAEERLSGRHVAVLAEQHVDQVPVPVDGAIQIAPAPMHFQVCLIYIPAAAHLAAPAPPQLLGQGRRELGFPVPDRLVAEHDAAHGKHLGQVAQAQLVAQAPEHHEGDDVGGILGPVQQSVGALVELLAARTAAEPAVALGGALGSLRDGFRAAFQAPHLRPPLCEKRALYPTEPSSARGSGASPDRTDPGAGSRLLRLMPAVWLMVHRVSHLGFLRWRIDDLN